MGSSLCSDRALLPESSSSSKSEASDASDSRSVVSTRDKLRRGLEKIGEETTVDQYVWPSVEHSDLPKPKE